MIGHRRPASLVFALARAAMFLCACLSAGAFAQNPPAAEPLKLRITWGGGEASQWHGQIAVDDGSFSNLNLLESESDATASIWLDDGKLQVATLSPHELDRIELNVQSGPNAKILVDLAAIGHSAPPRLEIPLTDLPRHPYRVRLDDRGNTLEIRVIPPPSLRIEAKRRSLVYGPGESCSFELRALIPGLAPGTEINVQTTLSEGRGRDPIWKSDAERLSVPVNGQPNTSFDVPLPKIEGVYTIRVAATRPSGFERFWSSSTRLAERSFQVVVLDARPSQSVAGAQWESVLEIDPTNPRWLDRLPGWTQIQHIPGFNRNTLGSGRTSVVDLPLGSFVELPPSA
ncbi:MAG TPA: hypothetical protein VFW73_13025, partial [Lacipirellulaceae bacterium]|nr:hypothetical protein [Lacipirellulaceae bacterium]